MPTTGLGLAKTYHPQAQRYLGSPRIHPLAPASRTLTGRRTSTTTAPDVLATLGSAPFVTNFSYSQRGLFCFQNDP